VAKRNLEYFNSFTPEMKRQIVDYVFRTNPKRRRDIIPSFEMIQKAVKDVLTLHFFEARHGDPRSVTEHNAEGEEDIEELVQRLKEMSAHDQAYA
jgi:hypothetical protein